MPLNAETVEKIDELLSQLKEKLADGAKLLVEGKKDVIAMRKLGFEENVLKISFGGPLLNAVQELVRLKEVILLPDFDERGEELLKFYSKHLERLGVKCDVEVWKKLRKMVKKDVHDIEGFVNFFLRQKERLLNPRSNRRIF
ncbi:MAG: toprim domain-containing protein [Candidatus Hadarchaeales archaeon]